jgi:hypothetical protein
MTKNLTNSVLLALVLFGSAALVAEPAFAGSYRHGHSGWNKNARNYSYRRHSYGRAYGFNTYGGPRNGYGSGGYYYGSPYNYYGARPGFSITIR